MAKQTKQPPRPFIWVLVICIVLLLAGILLLSFWTIHLQEKLLTMRSEVYSLQAQIADLEEALAEPAATEPTATEPPTEPVTLPAEPADTPTAPAPEDQPAELTALLEPDGITYDMLAEKQCTQLITVEANGNKAGIRMFVCTDGLWQEQEQLKCSGFLGRNGSARNKQEGDGCTPLGLYSIGSGFYIREAPETGLDLFQITKDTYWVDDPHSQFYNQRVEGTENKDWKSAEHMIDYPEYLYGFVVDYNLAAETGAGSAIFFHINDNPTAGCIATNEEMVLARAAGMGIYRSD